MSLKLLVAILNWLQEQFSKAAGKHQEAAVAYSIKIADLKASREEELQSSKLAAKLAENIDNLLSQ